MIDTLRKNARRVVTVMRREISYFSPRPIEVSLELTHRCNLRCKMCGVWGKKNDQRAPELTLNEYVDLFSQMKRLNVKRVTLAGGEPFIRKDIFEIIAAAKNQGLRCNMFTNGTLIDSRAINRLFQSRLDKIIISMDGFGAVHDSVRGLAGGFDRTLAALTAMVAERDSRRTKQPEIDVHMTLLKENVGDLSRLHAVCEDLGVNFSFQPYSETNDTAVGQTRLNGETIGSIRYLPHHESLRFTAELAQQLKDEISRLPGTFYTKLLSSLSNEDLEHGRMPIKKCYITRNIMMIDPYGDVHPCTNLDGYIVGSVRNETLSVIWTGEQYKRLREKLSENLLPICAYCCHCADNLTIAQLINIIMARS